jgi:hypothetical protein
MATNTGSTVTPVSLWLTTQTAHVGTAENPTRKTVTMGAWGAYRWSVTLAADTAKIQTRTFSSQSATRRYEAQRLASCRKRGALAELDWQPNAIQVLTRMGFWVMRMNIGRKRQKGGVDTGTPDLLVQVAETKTRGARHCWIELKEPGKEPNPSQAAWHARAKAMGIKVLIAYSTQDVADKLRAWLDE